MSQENKLWIVISILLIIVAFAVPQCTGNANAHQQLLLKIEECEDKWMRAVLINDVISCRPHLVVPNG